MNQSPASLLVIVASFVVVAALAGFYLGRYTFQTVPHGFPISLSPQPLVEEMGLEGASAQASFDPASGRMLIEIVLPQDQSLPEDSYLEGWLLESSHEPYYELSTGRVSPVGRGGRYLNFFSTENTLGEYDAIAVTLENDFDPRPGRVLFRGKIS